MSEPLPELESKIVYVYVKGLSNNFDDGITLESCALRTIGERLFLVGRTVVQFRPEWLPGPQTSVAWDDVAAFCVYSSRDEMAAAADRTASATSDGKPSLLRRWFGTPAP